MPLFAIRTTTDVVIDAESIDEARALAPPVTSREVLQSNGATVVTHAHVANSEETVPKEWLDRTPANSSGRKTCREILKEKASG